MRGDPDMLDDTELLEQLRILKSLDDANLGHFVRLAAYKRLVLPDQSSLRRRINSGNQIEQCCLARSVGSKDTNDFAARDGERNVGNRG